MEGGPSDPMEEYVRQRSAFQDGQAQVEGLVNFIKERVAMEENYAKSLTKLSKHSLSIDGANLTPVFFQPLAFAATARPPRRVPRPHPAIPCMP